MENTVIQGDCLEVMKDIPDKSIDMILCDLPYGTTACKWDTIIPFEPLWAEYKRIIKKNGAIVLFGAEPFSSALRMSAIDIYKYDWKWQKNTVTGFMQAKTKPLKSYEDIIVFGDFKVAAQYFKGCYNPQAALISKGKVKYSNKRKDDHITGNRAENVTEESFSGYPKDVLLFDSQKNTEHPTQKPVALCEYLIKTYTNEGDLVLDNCAGSGTTAIACINTKRNYILIEKELEYIDIINKRLSALQ